MDLLRRSIKSLRHYWKRTSLVFGMYSILFSLLLIMVVMNISSGTQIEDTQRSIGNSVFIRKVRLNDTTHRPSLSRFREEEVETLTRDSRVAAYNVLVMNNGNLLEGEPYIADKKRYEETLKRAPYLEQQLDNARFIGVTDSRHSVFYAGVGFRIVQGKGITLEDEGKKVVLVSETLSKMNGWKVGDKISLGLVKQMGKLTGEGFEAEIQGIFECPRDIYTKDTIEYTPDCLPENYIFIPQATITAMNPLAYMTNMVYVYLENPALIEGYIADMEQKLGDVVKDITQVGWQAKFRYTWDKEWNQAISAPYREIYNMTKAAMWIILAGTLAVVVLITSGELREKRREFGIWLACGEKPVRILLQTLFEKVLPIAAAVFLALFVSLAAAKPVSNAVIGESSQRMNRQVQVLRQNVNFWESVYMVDAEIQYGNYDYFYINDSVDLYRSRGAIAAAIGCGTGVLVIILSIQIWLAIRRRPGELLGEGE